jgi:hypothetical protein
MEPEALIELAAALKHDLGKYVAWRSANLDEAAWTGPVDDMLVESLQADILRTRESADGARPAWEVFDARTEPLPRPLAEPELSRVEAAVAVLRDAGPALAAGDRAAIGARRGDIRRAQGEIRSALRDFHRRLLQKS